MGPGPAPPSLTTTDTGSHIVRAGHKRYFFDLGSNNKGQYLRITEVWPISLRSAFSCPQGGSRQHATRLRQAPCHPICHVMHRRLVHAVLEAPAVLRAGRTAQQVAGQDRIAIIVPAEALPQFYRAVGLCLEERQGGVPSSSQRPL